MQKLMAMACLVLAASPLVFAQDKAKDDKHKAQRERQRSCDKMAKDRKMKSDDRKVFMQDCLSTKK